MIEIDGEFIWFVIENLFNTNLLPKWQNLDCVDETDEFSFIIHTLELIFDLDLQNINPAYLTLRKPEYIYIVLNALSLANRFIKKTDDRQMDSNDECCGQNLNQILSDSQILSDRSSKLSINLSESCDESLSKSSEIGNDVIKNKITDNKAVESNDCSSSLESYLKSSNESLNKVKEPVKKELKIKNESKDEQFVEQLKDLKNNKKLIHNLIYKKEQNFALEISYKILDVLKIQQKTKSIKTNLNRIQFYDSNQLEQSTFQLNQTGSFSSLYRTNQLNNRFTKPKKLISKSNKIFLKKNPSIKQNFKKQQSKPLDLNEFLNKLTGLTSKQVNEMKEKSDHQKQLINQVKYDLLDAERRLHSQMLTKLDKENRLLEILHKDLNLNLNLSAIAKNRSERKRLKDAKYELRKERVCLKKDFDEFYLSNLSNLKQLEHEQDKKLRELARKKAELFKQDLHQVRKEIKEYENKMKENQKLLLDNYDNFYLSQSILIQEELKKQKNKNTNSNQFSNQSVKRHLERSFLNKLYPKLS